MTVVVDASVLVAALTDTGPEGDWAEDILASGELVAPHLVLVETANILRRLRVEGKLTPDESDAAFRDLQDLSLSLQAFEPFGARIWQLKDSVTSYDSRHVAIAEAFALPLATLDRRLARATGVLCEIRSPD